MPKRRNTVPTHRHHKASGQGFVILPGTKKPIYTGVWGTEKAERAYKEVARDYLAAVIRPAAAPPPPNRKPLDTTVNALCVEFVRVHLHGYSESETKHYQSAVALLVMAAGELFVEDFGPLALTRVRDAMLARGWTREHINAQVRRVRAIFRWGESVEAVPAGKWFQLRSLIGLKTGKSTAKDQRKKSGVSDDIIDATLPHLSVTVAGMVRFQRLTGCRPQDVCNLNAAEIDRTGDVWVFRPDKHKTAHRGQVRNVYIGPKAQEVIRALVDAAPDAPAVFSPRAAWSEGRSSGAKGGRKGYVPKGPPINVGVVFGTMAYITAIRRGCERAGVKKWTPNQLRHAALTQVREQHGLETAQKIGGHKHASTTERYASPTERAAVEFASKHG